MEAETLLREALPLLEDLSGNRVNEENRPAAHKLQERIVQWLADNGICEHCGSQLSTGPTPGVADPQAVQEGPALPPELPEGFSWDETHDNVALDGVAHDLNHEHWKLANHIRTVWTPWAKDMLARLKQAEAARDMAWRIANMNAQDVADLMKERDEARREADNARNELAAVAAYGEAAVRHVEKQHGIKPPQPGGEEG